MQRLRSRFALPARTLTLAIAGLLTLSIRPAAKDSDAAAPGLSSAAPTWELKDPDGKPVKSSAFKGRVVILDFWATWCGPCRSEIPGFVELQKRYGAKGLTVVGVSLDEAGAKVVKPFMKQFGIQYPVVLGDEKIVRDYGGIAGIPTTFVIDRQGVIAAQHPGFAAKQVFESEIKPLLEK
jgi:thiol-disulfide isomerase/thioredoxin